MGRIGTDVVALACIAGGALAAAAVTAGVMAGGADAEYRVVTRHCVSVEAPRIFVRLHGEDGEATVTTRSYSAQAGAADAPCVTASSIAVVRTAEWTEEIGAQLDAARAEVDGIRLEADEMRLRADELRIEAEGIRLKGDELRFGDDQEAALEALEELLAGMRDSPAKPVPPAPAPAAPGSGGN
ncbi:MAG: hypothetical protein KJO11_12515 [Gemmatimonadetes bacterium]|nr:hypothetical protein [Gemmatimonadota bacterium]MBT8402712.1 hypothetical protein [Gemmatimonadota bacterium]NNK62761.1 hypothetical protein [Gemmatimonadota bacterium]